MAFKDFFKRNLDNVLVCTTLLLPPIMMGGPFVADAYHSHQYNKDPVRYQKRAIEERIKGLEKRNELLSGYLEPKEPSLLRDTFGVLSFPARMPLMVAENIAETLAYGREIGPFEEKLITEYELEELREAYSEIEN
ncbi:MAG TPA: hypothetical protein VJA86_02195 [Candidatus Nanoarchaeia archaeon]|nr:hypothetical protein [Candidatus Nanoarchaeia archaeon]